MNPKFSNQEVSTLLERVVQKAREEQATGSGAIQPYELGNQNRIIRGRMPGLEAVHDRFAKTFSHTLGQHLRRSVTITRRAIELISMKDLSDGTPSPSALTVFGLSPLRGQGLLTFEQRLVHALIDLMFGGSGQYEVSPVKRSFTGIEMRMVAKIARSALNDLGAAWKPFVQLKPHYERIETSPKLANISTPEEVIVVTTFDVEIHRNPMTLRIGLPYLMLDPIRTRLDAALQQNDEEVNHVNAARLAENLRHTQLQVSVALGTTRISLRHFLKLKAGDVLRLEQDAEAPLSAALNGVTKFRGTQGAYKGKVALRVEEVLTPRPRFRDVLDDRDA